LKNVNCFDRIDGTFFLLCGHYAYVIDHSADGWELTKTAQALVQANFAHEALIYEKAA
jgi:hypothetical protein